MTDCEQFQSDLKAYADRELPFLSRVAFRRHLTRCVSCQKEIAEMTQIAKDLRESETDAALPADLRAKILAATGEEAPPPQVWGAGRGNASSPVPPELGARGRSRRPALAWAIAAAALIAWFVIFPVFQKARIIGHASSLNRPTSTASFPPEPQVAYSSGASPAPEIEKSDRRYVPTPAEIKPQPPLHLVPPPKMEKEVFGVTVQNYSSGATSDAMPLRQVHKEASIGVQVVNPETTSDTVESMVKETGGYVASNTLTTGDDGLKSAELVVKVPVAQFEIVLGQVARLGSVQSKNVSGEDITEQISDADQAEGVLEDDVQQSEARLNSLGTRAKWRDEESARDLRIQLAQAQARLQLLKKMAVLSTITVDLSQTPKTPAPPPVTGGFLNGVKGNTHDALQSLLSSAGALLALMIWLLAYAPLWIPALLIGRYALQHYQKSHAEIAS